MSARYRPRSRHRPHDGVRSRTGSGRSRAPAAGRPAGSRAEPAPQRRGPRSARPRPWDRSAGASAARRPRLGRWVAAHRAAEREPRSAAPAQAQVDGPPRGEHRKPNVRIGPGTGRMVAAAGSWNFRCRHAYDERSRVPSEWGVGDGRYEAHGEGDRQGCAEARGWLAHGPPYPNNRDRWPGRAEQRATSSLLAVMKAVPQFGRAVLAPVGAPAGRISTFTEVQFVDEDVKLSIPDRAAVVEWGKKRWVCLIEVKTVG